MAYSSPIHLLNHFGVAYNENDLVRIRKILLAEINLEKNGALKFNNTSYTRNDIINIIDELAKNGDLEAHWAIFKNKAALSFFENPEAIPPVNQLLHFFESIRDEKLKSFCETKLADALSEFYTLKLQNHLYSQLSPSLVLVNSLDNTLQAQINGVIRKQLALLEDKITDIMHEFNDLERAGDEFTLRLEFIYKNKLPDFLNALPADLHPVVESLIKKLLQLLDFSYYGYWDGIDFGMRLNKEITKIMLVNDALRVHLDSELLKHETKMEERRMINHKFTVQDNDLLNRTFKPEPKDSKGYLTLVKIFLIAALVSLIIHRRLFFFFLYAILVTFIFVAIEKSNKRRKNTGKK